MHDNKHIDKKLQELENQSLPDLSKMDAHWQQMKSTLQPDVVPSKPKSSSARKFFRWTIAAVFIGGSCFMAYKISTKDKPGKTAAAKTKLKPSTSSQSAKDTSHPVLLFKKSGSSDTAAPVPLTFTITGQQQPKTPKQLTFTYVKKSSDITRLKFDAIYIKDKPDTLKITPAPPAKDDAAALAAFFKQLEKQPQEFVINNKRDTVIAGKEGNSLYIPANTFNTNEQVVIAMKEYYTYSDIVTNKLSTSSNGMQLITGGMLHIKASVKDEEISMQPGKSIRWFIPDTTAGMKQMRLFNGVMGSNLVTRVFSDGDGETFDRFVSRDTTPSFVRSNNVNWVPQPNSFNTNFLYTNVKVVDLRNEPYRTRETKNGPIGFFCIDPNSKISNEEMEASLKKKYGYYKVKVKKGKERAFGKIISFASYRTTDTPEMLGDSVWMDINIARIYRLPATDTIVSTTGGVGAFELESRNRRTNITSNNSFLNSQSVRYLADRYSVELRTLGWINCDRFLNDNSPRVDFYVNLKDIATNYQTFLVFNNIRSMLTGAAAGNNVYFSSIPKGLSAKIISVGIQNGKPVLAVKDVILSADPVNDLVFESTTPVAFKEEVARLDK